MNLKSTEKSRNVSRPISSMSDIFCAMGTFYSLNLSHRTIGINTYYRHGSDIFKSCILA